MVEKVKQRRLLAFPLALMIILGFTITATAFYFDFHYFETDKMVYEVGESVNMVASLIADFSIDGYCFISFAIVTDQGPAFADEYFIPPSPNTRLMNSTYTIHPEDTAPGVNGTTAYALFNIELYDSVIQGASDNIEFTINRGHLTVYPQSSLIIPSGTNSTLTLRVASIYNSNISYADEEVGILIRNQESEIIVNENTTTNSLGEFIINWNQSMGLPGIYNLVVTGFGNEDFLEFSKPLQISVIPTTSNLTIISAPESIQCQSPEGTNFDYANITVKHETMAHQDIDDSVIYWNTDFGSGIFTFTEDGQYSASIPFDVPPGSYFINVSATNSQYQNATTSIVVETVRNPLSFTLIENPQMVTHGTNISIEFSVEEGFEWNEEIPLDIIDSATEISQTIAIYPGTLNSLTITAFHNISVGPHNLTIQASNDYYRFPSPPEFQIIIIGELVVDVDIEYAFYAESILLNISVANCNGDNIELLNLSIYNGTNPISFIANQQINTTELVSIQLPSWINPGNYEFRFELVAPYYMSESLIKNVTVIMRTNITIIIETEFHYNLLNSRSDSIYSISLHQVAHSVLSYDRRQFCSLESLHKYLVQHAILL